MDGRWKNYCLTTTRLKTCRRLVHWLFTGQLVDTRRQVFSRTGHLRMLPPVVDGFCGRCGYFETPQANEYEKVVSMYPKSCTLCCLLTVYTIVSQRHSYLSKYSIVSFFLLCPRNCGLCGLTVERSLAILKVVGLNVGQSDSRYQPWASRSHACASVTKQYRTENLERFLYEVYRPGQ